MVQERMMGASIKMEDARKVVEAMLEAARRDPDLAPMAFAVVDTGGSLVYFARMDGGTALNSRVSINKAYTCIDTRRDTIDQEGVLKKSGRDIANFGEPRLAAIPGGVLLRAKDGSIAGAVGTSGRQATGPMGDEELARIGAKAYQ